MNAMTLADEGDWGTCEGCGAARILCGPPINEAYCPNKACDWEMTQLFNGIALAKDAAEKQEYERLKAKFG